MPRRAIYTDVMKVIERRIAEGDYMLMDLPGERKIAEEVGVSYMTARKAVQHLIDRKLLFRKANGSLVTQARLEQNSAKCHVVLMTPAYPSLSFIRSRLAISQLAEKRDVLFRPVEYVHWYDPVVSQVLRGSDGIIIIPSTEPIPVQLQKEFRSPEHRVVFFDDDRSSEGLPSICLYPESHILGLFEHLWSLGHRRIDCLNTQGHNLEIERRITLWRNWLARRGITGTLWDTPTPAFGDPTALGLQTMHQVLSEARPRPPAIVCTTQATAIGAMRACYEQGISVGKDLALCSINNERTGRYFCPSMTGLEVPDLEPLFDRCLQWFESPKNAWQGDLRVEPARSNLFLGESTQGLPQ